MGAYNDRDHWVVARNEDEAQEEASRKYNGKKFLLSQDPDVLFYPTSVLETGHDTLFFWAW